MKHRPATRRTSTVWPFLFGVDKDRGVVQNVYDPSAPKLDPHAATTPPRRKICLIPRRR